MRCESWSKIHNLVLIILEFCSQMIFLTSGCLEGPEFYFKVLPLLMINFHLVLVKEQKDKLATKKHVSLIYRLNTTSDPGVLIKGVEKQFLFIFKIIR